MSKRRSRRWQRFAAAINRTFRLRGILEKRRNAGEYLLCRCEDVRCGDVAAADATGCRPN
ncbi:hypothetical protein MJ390_04315 [Klebsiella pneumoniae]|nr:hypothetical protein MJ390_04315 [Klebsiella pneumoniae]